MEVLVAVAAVVVIAVAAGLKFWAATTLMCDYRVDEYVATSKARRLYWIAAAAPAVIGAAIFVLAWCTSIWWVEAAGAVLWGLILYGVARRLWVRFSGRYVEFYRQRQWR